MAPLPSDMGESAKCPACSTFTNLGEYDWVLSEITQPEEFIDLFNNRSNRDYLKSSIQEKLADVHGASIQILEDRASNAYLQLRIAHAMKDFSRIRRFSHDNFYKKMEEQQYEPYLFNRLYLRDVTMLNLLEDKERFYAVFSMGCREQKVKIKPDNKLEILESTMVTRNDNIVLCLRKDHDMGGYPVLAHNCSNCGGGVMDSVNVNCSFCGSVLNSDKKDWILYDMLSGDEYNEFRSKFDDAAISRKKENKLGDDSGDIRDYVLNNTMLIMMADGVLGEAEKEYMAELSKSLGYNANKVSALWENTSVNSIALKMPNDKKSQQKVFKKMLKAADADGVINANEKAILDEVRMKYELSEN
jgi:tellurite resistance protein